MSRHLRDVLASAPDAWGRWGADDEVGALNELGPEQVLEAARLVRRGEVFALGQPVADPAGDPALPGRTVPRRYVVSDASHFAAGARQPLPGGLAWADDFLVTDVQFGTHCDALGHMWFDDQLYNGHPASTGVGGLTRASIEPIGRRGIVGRGVLVDVARHRGVASLARDDTIGLAELLAAAERQGVEVGQRSILLLHTGWLAQLRSGAQPITPAYREPGLTFSLELVRWFADQQVACLVTDTLGNEATVDPASGVWYPLHAALMRNLGVVFTEAAWLTDLAQACAATGTWEFLYCAAPIPVIGASGAPVNPLALL